MKQKVKISILFIILLVILVGGWFMYQRMKDDRIAFETNIYENVSPVATQIIHVARNHHLPELYEYNNDFKFVLDPLHKELTYPLIIVTFRNRGAILIFKTNRDQEKGIKNILNNEIAPNYSPQIQKYKGVDIYTKSLANDKFLSYTIHNGIFAISKEYKAIEDFLNRNKKESYFTHLRQENIVLKLRNNSPISIFSNHKNQDLVFDYQSTKDSIVLNGYLLSRNNTTTQSIDSNILDYIHVPTNYLLDTCIIDSTTSLKTIRAILNKIE